MARPIGVSATYAVALPGVPIQIAAVVYLLLLAVGDRLLNDPDIYWHLVVGRWIVDHGAFPRTDVFSQTFAGTPWIAKEWLSQLIYAGAHAVGGWTAMVVIAACAIATAFALLARFLLERLALIPTLLLTAAALVLAAPHLVARPHVLALPLMVVWFGGLVRALDEARAPSVSLLPVMTLWANLHGGFTIGLVLIAPIAFEGVIAAAAAMRRTVAIRWMRFALLACIAACITPYGPESILVTYRILNLGEALSIITEWQPQDFSHFAAFEACLLIAVGFALYRGLTLPPLRIIVVLVLLHLALAHVRNAELLGFLAPIFVAAPLARQLGAVRKQAEGPRTHPIANGTLLALLVAVTSSVVPAGTFAPNVRVSPADAVRVLKGTKAERVFNDYDFGGYLIYAGIAPFIDGRTELYGGAFTTQHHRAVTLQDVGDFLRFLDENRIGATLLRSGTPAVGLLDRLGNWKRVHADDVAIVHVREPGEGTNMDSPVPRRGD